MKHLFQDLIRRNVVRVAAIYIILGWLLRRFTDFMIPTLGLPEFFSGFVTVLIFLGLPVCLYLSWAYEHTGDGLKLTKAALPDELQASYRLSSKDLVLTLVMGAVLVIVSVDTFLPTKQTEKLIVSTDTTLTADSAETEDDKAFVPDASSIAVLPFADMSQAKDQEYFSDGIAEEVLNALVKVRGLKVAGRTSSFAFKGSDADTGTIAKTLNVAYVLQGSVRKQGNQLRISVQLTKADTGFQLWAKTYNGSVTEIFDVQENIARAVANELKVVLTGEDTARLTKRQPINDEAYTAYLSGKRFLAARIGDSLPRAIEAFEESVSIDKTFARAWAGLATAHAISPQYRVVSFAEAETSAEINALKALQLDPTLSEPHAVLGWIYLQRREYMLMREAFEDALAIDPEDVTTNLWYGVGNVAVGAIEEADRRFSFVVQRDPVALVGLHMQSLLHWMIGQSEEAERRATRVYQMGYTPAGIQLSEITGERGEIEKSRDFMAMAMRGMATRFDEEQRLIMGEGLFGSTAARDRARSLVDTYLTKEGPKQEIFIPYFLIHIGETEKAFSVYEQNRAAFDPMIYYGIWGPYGESARQHPDFPAFADRIGLTEYWRAFGWPDACRTPSQTSLACE